MTSRTHCDRQIPLVLKYRQNRLVIIQFGCYAHHFQIFESLGGS